MEQLNQLSDGQKRSLKWVLNDPREILIWTGSIRAGKTFGSVLDLVMHSVPREDEDYILGGKSSSAIRRNMLPYFKEIAKGLGLYYHDSGTSIQVGKNRFHIFGGYHSTSQDVIQGMTASGGLLDDAGLLTQGFFQMCVSRCSREDAKLILTMNKGNPYHWTKKELVDKTEEMHALHIDSDISENPGISDTTKSFYERTLSAHWKTRLLKNEWCAATGLCFPSFEVITELPDHLPKRVECSVDYGITNPTAAIYWGLYGNMWIAIDEYYWDPKVEGVQLSSSEHAQHIVTHNPLCSRYYVDPSAAALKVDLRKHKVPVVNANNDVLFGIQCGESAFLEGRAAIYDGCTNLLSEISQYVWDEKLLEVGKDAPTKQLDHAVDAMRYFICTKMPIRGTISIGPKPHGL